MAEYNGFKNVTEVLKEFTIDQLQLYIEKISKREEDKLRGLSMAFHDPNSLNGNKPPEPEPKQKEDW